MERTITKPVRATKKASKGDTIEQQGSLGLLLTSRKVKAVRKKVWGSLLLFLFQVTFELQTTAFLIDPVLKVS